MDEKIIEMQNNIENKKKKLCIANERLTLANQELKNAQQMVEDISKTLSEE
ncbi:MAG: hypothetical protein N2749_03315 [Clostridia bacterium]|nr:hypothetical protein [Clostridia bacterium]